MENKNKKWEQQYLSIREISNMLGISQPTLRYYESEGLVHPVRSQSSNYRKYSFLSLIELTDILLYRNLGIPVKEIHTLLHSPITDSLDAVDDVIDDTYRQIERLHLTLRQLSLFERKIRKYLSLLNSDNTYTIVEKTGIAQLYTFSFENAQSMGDYISNPYSFPYGFYMEDSYSCENFMDCMIETASPNMKGNTFSKYKEELIWDSADYKCKYLQCLLRTEYGMTAKNNLQEHLKYMKEHDMKPGFVVAEYLVYDYSPEEKERYDYYLIWIQIL